MRTQDNRITADPIFMVRQRKRIYGMDQDYAGDDYVWSDKEANELIVYSDEELDAWIEKENTVGFQDEKCKWSRDDFEKIFYVDVWEDVQPFFTEVAANQYIVANRHNLTDPHVYVKCAYRNWEWQLLREFLMEGGKSESGEEDQANDYV